MTKALCTHNSMFRYACGACNPSSLFQGYSHLKSLAVCKTKGREPGLHVATPGRQRIDIQGALPDEDSQSPSCNVQSEGGGQSAHNAASIMFVIHDVRDGSMQSRNCYVYPQST